ncbi:bifunctional folylpolyglutamate synthase/dihydrofolate synthase [Fundicoccus culcitae]|uniref:Bifunctional folylpolyglutamate synthase/dihydrofolate synthase n=1 Tax=Fundicoccus culcitae TaxID=2969821 RepID=A0ABY5P5J6_9LACT|nr:folylpolyglutamate synthase/dihydrofolate synthase family protein [Fundicoccus culcitae]UUX34027.1 bifunctional folylpolyglutamate synthase/dihydrofolate synthase [Fundicoccus culcitae]
MKFYNVHTAIEWLNQQTNDISRVGIDKIRVAVNYVGNPEKDLPAIHITGTNGKGSTTAFLRDLLLSQGLTVGSFTSPHIMRFNERIMMNGEPISDQDLIEVIEQMVEVNTYMETTPYGKLVFFELYTVMMLLYFRKMQPDVCLIEVGIGGENDCTNVIDAQLAVLTTIGLDHADKLGDTKEEVAHEKAGIIKPFARVVTGLIEPGPLAVIEQRVEAMHAHIDRFNVEYGITDIFNHFEQGSTFNLWQKNIPADETQQNNFVVSMLGLHQIQNASVALQAFINWMDIIERPIDWVVAKPALQQTKWIARMERIYNEPLVYIDGAHNVAGLTALRQLVQEHLPHYQLTILYAGLSTKNQLAQLPLLLSFEPHELLLTEFNHPHAMTVDNFQELIDQVPKIDTQYVHVERNWQQFIDEYLLSHQTNTNQLLVITGSLYFVSEIRQYFAQNVK